jgi:hypothetical protein
MSRIDKYISSKEILNRVIRDGGYKGNEFSYADSLEWIVECMDLIGVPTSLKPQIACITIENHKGVLPCDYHSITQASALTTGGIQVPMRSSGNTFHPLFLNTQNTQPFIAFQEPISYDANGNPVFNFMNFDSAVSKQLVNELPYTFMDVTYNINDNYIITSFKDGAKVLISYKAFPIDEDGYPLVPDNEKFKQAVQWYVMSKLGYRSWIKGSLSDKAFNYIETQRDWYIGAATTAGLNPTYDEMESLKNEWVKLLPRFTAHDSNYSGLGNQEFYTGGQKKYRF